MEKESTWVCNVLWAREKLSWTWGNATGARRAARGVKIGIQGLQAARPREKISACLEEQSVSDSRRYYSRKVWDCSLESRKLDRKSSKRLEETWGIDDGVGRTERKSPIDIEQREESSGLERLDVSPDILGSNTLARSRGGLTRAENHVEERIGERRKDCGREDDGGKNERRLSDGLPLSTDFEREGKDRVISRQGGRQREMVIREIRNK
ncbi:hypothetical protein B0H14DRAFT_3672867 [Mycena olivaceomarginata]|nr:hypothetical protein B0H14DRAFT_3672867 [Mycena olivaceomarginata]